MIAVASGRIIDLPELGSRVAFKPGTPRRFVVTVDTEEEFDWTKPLQREGHSVHTVGRLARFQEFCEAEGVVPIYLIDYPIATSPAAAGVLREAVAAGRAEIGVQLHPWVSPPFEEEVTQANSYAGNLPEPLERAKFEQLRAAIVKNFNTAPLIYRAGRYGVGPNTAQILIDNGLTIDSSVRSHFDYSASFGPNFRGFPLHPYWLDRAKGLFELPLTTVYWGPLRQLGPWLYPRMWRVPRLRGALARIGLLERIPLTPEGVTLEEAIRAIDIAIDDDVPVLVFSFHSPSLAAGFTPYVRSEADLDAFFAWWRGVFAHLRRREIAASSVAGIMDTVELAQPQTSG